MISGQGERERQRQKDLSTADTFYDYEGKDKVAEEKKGLEKKVEDELMENPPFHLRAWRTIKFAGEILKTSLLHPRHYWQIEAYITSDRKVKTETTLYHERPEDW